MIWTVTENGKRMPVDVEPSPAGTFALIPRGEDEPPLAVFAKKAVGRSDWDGFKRAPHHATCPKVAEFRK